MSGIGDKYSIASHFPITTTQLEEAMPGPYASNAYPILFLQRILKERPNLWQIVQKIHDEVHAVTPCKIKHSFELGKHESSYCILAITLKALKDKTGHIAHAKMEALNLERKYPGKYKAPLNLTEHTLETMILKSAKKILKDLENYQDPETMAISDLAEEEQLHPFNDEVNKEMIVFLEGKMDSK